MPCAEVHYIYIISQYHFCSQIKHLNSYLNLCNYFVNQFVRSIHHFLHTYFQNQVKTLIHLHNREQNQVCQWSCSFPPIMLHWSLVEYLRRVFIDWMFFHLKNLVTPYFLPQLKNFHRARIANTHNTIHHTPRLKGGLAGLPLFTPKLICQYSIMIDLTIFYLFYKKP